MASFYLKQQSVLNPVGVGLRVKEAGELVEDSSEGSDRVQRRSSMVEVIAAPADNHKTRQIYRYTISV